jgi:hypothetical protein
LPSKAKGLSYPERRLAPLRRAALILVDDLTN